MRKKKSENKKSNIFIVLVVILAILIVSSRACRITLRNLTPGSSEVRSETFHKQNPDSLTIKTEEPMPEISEPDKNILLGKLSSSQRDSLLSPIEIKYASRDGMYMHHEAYDAFVEMHEAAKGDGIELVIISAFRDFVHQRRIWNNKWNGQQVLSGNIYATDIANPADRALEILRFSAMPGTSRHHWGTDVDLNSLNNKYFEYGRGKREYEWLKENAERFGFCQPYTARGENRQQGYEEEKWHWSFKPVAAVYLRTFADSVAYDDISGFEGWETARQLNVIDNYVLSVNKDCFK
ncbi:MAG: D-alanyl-D-alanine carboxypeptidase family protein [Bacteroidetes bacterium]|nr:MAG: D-alanyl-D-alanine carboxypeptidase family protein [Bacteroidota bacterium]